MESALTSMAVWVRVPLAAVDTQDPAISQTNRTPKAATLLEANGAEGINLEGL